MLHSRSGSTDTLWVTSRGLGFSSLTAYNSTMVPPKPRTPIGSHTLQVECNNRCAATTITHTQPFYGSVEFVRDNPGEPVPEETFTHNLLQQSEVTKIIFGIY